VQPSKLAICSYLDWLNCASDIHEIKPSFELRGTIVRKLVQADGTKVAPMSGLIEDYLFLLALIVCLYRMLVSCLGFFNGLSGLLLCAHIVVTAVLLRGGTVGFRGLLMMFRGFLVHVFWHGDSSL